MTEKHDQNNVRWFVINKIVIILKT